MQTGPGVLARPSCNAGAAVQKARIYTLRFEACLPPICRRRVEQDIVPPLRDKPAWASHFLFKLSLAPSRVAQGDEIATWSAPFGDGLHHIQRSGKRSQASHGDRVLTTPVAAVQDEAPSRLDRSAVKDRRVRRVCRIDIELHEEIAQPDIRSLMPDADTDGSMLIMRAERNRRALEPRITDTGHREQHSAGKKARFVHPPKMSG